MDPNDYLRSLAVGGAQRPDSFTGMNPEFRGKLAEMFAAAPPEIASGLRIKSGYRSPEVQAKLYQDALAKYGSPEAARKWVAPPGHSEHNKGFASDLEYLSPAATKWAHENASRFGLAFPLSNENWHIELAGARGNQPPAAMPTGPQQVVAPAPVAATPFAQAPDTSYGSLALLFANQQANRQKQRAAEQEAEAVKRAALFAPQGVAGLYG